MRSTESMEQRIAMVDMHQFFLEKIDAAIARGNGIEASWLIYSCLENRYFRTLKKFKKKCKYCKKGGKCRSNSNQLALSTKIDCVSRLLDAGVSSISDSFDKGLIQRTKEWVKRRNKLTHNLLSLENYQQIFDEKFNDLAEEGKTLLQETYVSCTSFRDKFYTEGYEFVFPESCMEGCPCARNVKSSEQNNE